MLALAVALAATSAGALSLAPTSQAAACEQASGVTVVIDHGTTGDTSLGCATGDPASGLDALSEAGHAYTFLPRQPGFVCTIDARPDPCNNGPADAYWSYWHAQPDGSWSYANKGAASHDPEPGSVEGWSFGSGKPPSVTVSGSLGTTASGPLATTGSSSLTTNGSSAPASTTSDLPPDGRGGLGGLALAIGLVVPLGAGAAYLAWRRRRVSH